MVQVTDNTRPGRNGQRIELLAGLQRTQKTVSPKFFYDETGSRLFEEICRQPEYYPTRTEIDILQRHAGEMADLVGPQASVIEFGSGSSVKTRLLLDKLHDPTAYIPVDISCEHLTQAAEKLATDFPAIEVLPVCADFTQPVTLPTPTRPAACNVVFFPGSTLGNFSADEAIDLMRVMRQQADDGGALLIGIDLAKPREVVEPAYNDAAGVTAEFNLNLLRRLNREYDADFELPAFEHEAVYDEAEQRIEMRLVSLEHQSVHIAGTEIDLEAGEYIVTEHSYKYSPGRFAKMAREASFISCRAWSDANNLFSVQYLKAA